MPFIKLNQPKYLADKSYLIADTDPDSIYFDVSEVPDILTGGKNLFMLKGNKSLLAPGSTIEIEVTDLNGRAIYHENAVYLEPGTKRRAVAIYVYEHTPQGGGVITITGTAQKRPNGKSVSLDLQKTPNVKWQKKVNVLPFNENRTRVILDRTPVVQIKEVEKNYLIPSGGLTNGSITETKLPTYGVIAYEQGSPNGFGTGTITTTGSYFKYAMEGSIVDFSYIQDANIIYDSGMIAPELTEEPVTFYEYVYGAAQPTLITEVVNDQKAYIAGIFYTSVDSIDPFSDDVTTNAFYVVPGFTQGPAHSITYPTEATWLSSEQVSESWAKVDIAELDPICGDIKRLAVYKKSQGVQQWHFVTDVVLENQELLARDDAQGLKQNLGQFRSQDIIDTYWTSSYGDYTTAIGSNPSKNSDATVFINGALISGSEALVAATTAETRLDAYAEFRMKPSADFNGDGSSTAGLALKANTSYILSMKLAGQAVADGINIPVIKIFASGSAIDLPSEDSTMRKFATLQANSQLDDQGGPIDIIDESILNYHFDVSTAGDMAVVFRIVSGRWWISDVSVKPATQTGFTPNHTSVEFPMNQISIQNDIIDFKFELYDNIDNLVHTELTSSILWSGGNTYIDGDNGWIGDGIQIDATGPG